MSFSRTLSVPASYMRSKSQPNIFAFEAPTEKGSLLMHLTSLANNAAANGVDNELSLRRERFVSQTMQTMGDGDRETLAIRFNSAYYLCKKEKPFSEFSSILELQEKNGIKYKEAHRSERSVTVFCDCIGETLKLQLNDILEDVNYFALLSDGATDKGVIQHELIYVYCMDKKGRAIVYFMSIEKPKSADAKALIDSINESFEAVGVMNFREKLYAVNLDGAHTNLKRQKGADAILRRECPWLVSMHCFNYRLEICIKELTENTCFAELEEMLQGVYLLHLQSYFKRLRGYRDFEEVLENCFSEAAMARGASGWISHKSSVLKWLLDNYGAYMSHLEKLSVSKDSKPERKAEMQGFYKEWKEAKYPLYIAMCLDVLSTAQRLGLSEQHEENDPVKILNKIRVFTTAIAKLQASSNSSLDDGGEIASNKTYFQKVISRVKNTKGDSYVYQDIPLKNYESAKENILEQFKTVITTMSDGVNERFQEINSHPVFKHLVTILDCRKWPIDKDLDSFGHNEMQELLDHLEVLLENMCNTYDVMSEWGKLKKRIKPMLECAAKPHYLNIWVAVFGCGETISECRNVLHIIELLLITPFTNAPKLHRMFNRLERVKLDWRRKLTRKRLENLLRIGEDGPSIVRFNPDEAMARWSNQQNKDNALSPQMSVDSPTISTILET